MCRPFYPCKTQHAKTTEFNVGERQEDRQPPGSTDWTIQEREQVVWYVTVKGYDIETTVLLNTVELREECLHTHGVFTLQELGGAGLFNRSFQSSSDFWQLTRMIGEFKAGCGRLQRCCTLSFISQDVWIYSLSVSSRTRKPFSRYNTCTH